MKRNVMWLLLTVVAAAAAVLSFASLTGLAGLCGFSERLAWLLPVTVDAGAGAGCLVWLGTDSPERARNFARSLTWTLLASSVAGNAVVHYLGAYHLQPPWWLVVAVSAVAPTVLGSVVHLGMLVGRAEAGQAPGADAPQGLDPVDELLESGAGRRRIAKELGVTEHQARVIMASRNGHQL
jgi:hypothetical protein